MQAWHITHKENKEVFIHFRFKPIKTSTIPLFSNRSRKTIYNWPFEGVTKSTNYLKLITHRFISKVVHLKNEHEMVVGWEFNHTLLQDKLMLCKTVKHIGSFSVIFLMLSLLMFSTWMVVDSVICERVQMANNMCLIIMFVL